MIILRQKNYSILNTFGSLGNEISNELSMNELYARGLISSTKSKKLKEKLMKHAKKYQKVEENSEVDGYQPDQENLVWEKGKESKKNSIFRSQEANNPDNVRYSRAKSRKGSIQLRKNASPFIIAHEYGHGLDYAAPHGDERFTKDNRSRVKLGRIGQLTIGVDPDSKVKTPKEALELNKNVIEREVAADINALKLLKKKGASQKEIDRAKQEAKAALRTYRSAGRSQINYLMANSSLSDDLKFRREHIKDAKKQYKEAVKKIDNMYGPNKLAQKEKAALIGGATIAGLTAGSIALHKYRKNKNKKNKED